MANGKELATINEKALSFKAYLNNDNIKKQIMDAAPRMLNGERFLKVFYGAILRNPKLLDCTTESMLQAAMFFAQLGLEPILGRAYLVPYLNSKNVDGRWVKQLEVQAQVGYQGLVDLARRSGTISDVWGSSVYENDIFDLSYGMQRDLIHKPWFMDPVKRKADAGAGEFLGAYCVWQLKDGTKHPEFMPASEIWKRRAKSQSYNYAETGDPAKGGGKRDSVWHQWTEDMALKTVLKHSSKLVPASIEFLEAVAMDDDREGMGASTLFGGTSLQLPGPGPADEGKVFDSLVPNPNQAFDHFVKVTAEGNKMTVEAFKAKVVAEGRFEDLWKAYEKTLPEKAPASSGPPANGGAEQAPWARELWIKLRGAGYGDYVTSHLDAFRVAPEKVLLEAKAKWYTIYKGSSPWPLDGAKPVEVNQAPPVMHIETQSNHQISELRIQQPAQPQGSTDDPMAKEKEYLLSELRLQAKLNKGAIVLEAQRALGYPVGLEHIAACSLDALRELVDQIKVVKAEMMPPGREPGSDG